MFDIPQELKKLPHLPGVYMMKDEGGIIYVGKAKNLYNRVKSYFQKSQADPKTVQLAKNIKSFEYVVTDTENEAYILENILIKQHNPKYNIRLKDSKAYPYIKITQERLPRILYVNRRGRDKAKYYGPYVSGINVRELLDLIHRLWPLRRCTKVFPRDFEKGRPCLNHHIQQCKAPCMRLLDEETYIQYVREAELFIQGKTTNVQARLTAEMNEAAEQMEYERAAELRDTINALKALRERQKIETNEQGNDRDIIALARQDDEALLQIFFVRGGKLSGREHFIMSAQESCPDPDIFAAFIKQFYSEAAFIPKEIILASAPCDKEAISAWLSSLSGRQVQIITPKKGEKHKFVKLAQTNAELTMSQFGSHMKKQAERNAAAMGELVGAIRGTTENVKIARIEAYDISNIQGCESVGSMIVFQNGEAKKSDYRKFRLRETIQPDDYAGIREVLSRRFKRYNEQSQAFSTLPDIIFVDGGKGQISAAEAALREQGLDIPVCGMVKDERHRTRGLLYNNEQLDLPRHGEGFKLVTRIQDEVHRFALEYHRKLRADSQVRSVLDDITGIGATRRKELLRHFKSIEAIRAASVEELLQVSCMNKKIAQEVYNFFHSDS